ncbi:MAG: TonB-dependent receptor [Acidobacteria bacterium]|nr:TonB-dependent receptor [Acidobacteriota bacterium]
MLQRLSTFCFLSVSVFAQFDTGQIAGFVRDPSESVISGAAVTVRNEHTGEEKSTKANSSGYYVFPNLLVGSYSLSAEAAGFKKVLQTGITLSSSTRLSVDLQLTVGSVSETVEVKATVGLVQAESAVVGRTINSKQVADLTLNGRNPIYLALLKPGVRGGSIGTFDPDSVSNGGFSINGGRADEYVVMVDGAVATRTRSSGSMLGSQDVDTVEEVQILTANYSAEYGRSSAGQIRFVTKSGGQSFHGNLVENFRNSALDANTWTRNHSPNRSEFGGPAPFRFNQFGYDINGPVFIPGKFNRDKSKLFFLWAQEWIRRREEQNPTALVPSLLMRDGNFSELLNASNIFYGRVRTVTDPDSKLPFAGNMIPLNRLSPNGRALLRAYPQPTPGFAQTGANFIGSGARWSNTLKNTVKVDYVLNSAHRLSFRGTHVPWRFNEPFQDSSLGTFQALWSRPNRTGTISLTSTISPTFLNEFNFSANSDGKGDIPYNPACGAPCERSTYGINYPQIFPVGKEFPGKLPTIQIDPFYSLNNSSAYPGYWSGFVYAWSNNMTKIIGNHTMKFGIFIERSGQNDGIQLTTASAPATVNQGGQFRFIDTGHPNTSGIAVANAALGYFNDYSETSAKTVTPWVATGIDWFVQDSWKATKKLTLEIGLRHSIWPPWHSRWGTLSMFNPAFFDASKAAVIDRSAGYIVSGDPYNGITLPGSGPSEEALKRFPTLSNFKNLYHNLPGGFSQTHYGVFQPRLGAAYGVNNKTSVRAGLGAFANRTMINRDTALGGNPPFQLQQTVSNGNVDAPAGATQRVFPLTMTIQDPVLKVPMAWNWNATVARQLPWNLAVEVGYVGRRGIHNQRKRNINQLLTGTTFANPGVNVNALRPYPGMGVVGISENSGTSMYHGLQISVERRFSRGLAFGVAYTYSKATDNSSDLTDVLPDAYNDRAYNGTSDLNRPHVLILNYIYELPFLKGNGTMFHRALGNWELSAMNQWQSGGPFSVRNTADNAGVGSGSGNQFYSQVGDPYDVTRTGFTDSAVWFNKTAYARPANGTWGNQPRNGVMNPGFWAFDMGIRKNFPTGEHQRFQIRGEFFNLLNHPNWGGANSNPTSGQFGLVTSKSGNRTIQIALKYIF